MNTSSSERRTEHEVLTTREVATMLRVHIYTVHNLLKTGRLQGFKVNSRWRILRTSVDKFMEPYVHNRAQKEF